VFRLTHMGVNLDSGRFQYAEGEKQQKLPSGILSWIAVEGSVWVASTKS